MTTTINIDALKVSLLHLAREEPDFLKNLLKTVFIPNNTEDTDDINPLLQQIVEEDFEAYAAVFKKLA
jgi:hypothetical protein